MGACEVSAVRSGLNANSVFDALRDEAKHEYGYDAYNGSFSTCGLTRVHRMFSTYKKGNEDKAFKFLENRNIDKRDVEAVDLGVRGYVVKKYKYVKGKNSLKLRYVVTKTSQGNSMEYAKIFTSLDNAKAYALKASMETGKTYEVTKRYVDEKSHEQSVGYTTIESKEYKNKPKRIPKDAVVREVHVYAFYGWAAC